MSKLETLPAMIVDMILKLRDRTQGRTHRDNIALRLGEIVRVCQEELEAYRTGKRQ